MPLTAPRAAVRLLLAAAVLLAAALGVLGGATPALAHAALIGSSPAEGAVVASAPEVVTLSFSERIAMADDGIRVLDPNGDRADTGELQDLCSESEIRYGAPMRAGVPDGTYTVVWQAVSADSHPVSGAFTFSVGAPSETAVSVPDQQAGGGPVGTLYDVARYLAYGGFVLLVGGTTFLLAAWREGARLRPVQRLVVGGWLALTAATVATLLLRHPYTTGGSFGDSLDLAGLKAVLETRTGAAMVSRLVLLAVATLFLAVLFGSVGRGRSEKEQRDLYAGLALGGGVVGIGLATTWALAEHATTGIQTQIAIPAAVLHLLGVAVWLGGLAALLVALHRGGVPVPRSAVRRFSQLAFGSVLVLVGTGVYQSWRQVGSWSALTGTEYGRLLLAKLALLAVLLAAARCSRRWTSRLAPTPAEGAAEPEAGDGDAGPGQEGAAAAEPEAGTGAVPADPAPAPGAGAQDAAPDGQPATVPAAGDEREAQLARQAAAVARTRSRRERDADAERSGLRRTVLVEAAVAAVLLAVTTLLTGTEPGRTAQAAQAGTGGGSSTAVPDRPVLLNLPFDTGGPGGSGTAELGVDPGRTGGNTVHVRTDVDAEEIKVAFTLPDQDIGPLAVTPEPVPGEPERHWIAEGVQLPVPGEWRIALTIRTSDIDQVTVEKNVKIG